MSALSYDSGSNADAPMEDIASRDNNYDNATQDLSKPMAYSAGPPSSCQVRVNSVGDYTVGKVVVTSPTRAPLPPFRVHRALTLYIPPSYTSTGEARRVRE